MTINERVSDERIANLIEVLSFYSPEDKRLANNESELASALRELQQYRAAAKPVCYALTNSEGEVYNTHSSPENADAYRWLIHQSDDSLTLRVTPLYAAPQVTSVPGMAAVGEMPYLGTQEKAFVSGWNACRAAMLAAPAVQAEQLSGNTEHVSQPTLPLDYLQGYKDGCEWSALMAEANHPQTGDWLFDDPIELAKAIRKGPDMLPAAPKQEAL
ncbi:hypothetical protein [Atlantibacter hermannii]|uniref:hypothetical protein n=1 Tax=Atlantibacter hermannii TaxID=565 RepID=UPI0035B5AE16